PRTGIPRVRHTVWGHAVRAGDTPGRSRAWSVRTRARSRRARRSRLRGPGMRIRRRASALHRTPAVTRRRLCARSRFPAGRLSGNAVTGKATAALHITVDRDRQLRGRRRSVEKAHAQSKLYGEYRVVVASRKPKRHAM